MDELIVYTKNNCPQCNVLKARLKTAGIPFKEISVEGNQDARDFLIGQGHRSAPVMYRGGVHLKDFTEV